MIERAAIDHIIKSDQARYSPCGSPVGNLLIIGTDSRLLALMFRNNKNECHLIERKIPQGVNHSISACHSYLDHYFKHAATGGNNGVLNQSITFEKKSSIFHISAHGVSLAVDCSLFTPRECMVYSKLIRVPFGSTISYGDLARRSGFPGGARFIGNTMAKNIFPIIIPCHRVIRHDGTMGNYSGGVHIKEHLLKFENIHL